MYKIGDNVFVSFLDLLQVKHTKEFSTKYFNEHPHKYNLFGISKMLSDYGIENAGTKITDKETDLFNIELPFIAHFGNEFIVVQKIDSDKVHYILNGKKISTPVAEFLQAWTGIILLAESTSDSILAFINIITLPYIVWSVWYQKFKANDNVFKAFLTIQARYEVSPTDSQILFGKIRLSLQKTK